MADVKCNNCGQVDDHPKHVVHVGYAEVFGNKVFHPQDEDQDGYLEYHFDCDSEFEHLADPATVQAAKNGTHGEDLRNLITGV